MADTKNGRVKKAHDEERRQREHALERDLEYVRSDDDHEPEEDDAAGDDPGADA